LRLGADSVLYLQIIVNGLVLGGLYACIAAGFSLVWGVLNVINILHGSFIVLGSYAAFFAYTLLGISPFVSVFIIAPAFFVFGYLLEYAIINRVITAPVLLTLTLTFGLDLIVSNGMLAAFTANFKRLVLDPPLGSIALGGIVLPVDRLAAMGLAILLTLLLYVILKRTRIGRAIMAVRMDREAAALMGVKVNHVNAATFGLGAMMAGAAGALLAMIFPIYPLLGLSYLGKAFVICVLGGLGSVSGALVGGIVLAELESFGAVWFGAEHAVTLSFALLIIVLLFRPNGIMGRKGYV
jgi:branched-chain amino acid transport system permease protein